MAWHGLYLRDPLFLLCIWHNSFSMDSKESVAEMAGVHCYRDLLPIATLVTMECVNVGLNTLFKAATLDGMSYHVFVVYSYALAALALLPGLLCSYRSRILPPLSSSILCKIGLLGIIGSSSQIMGYTGINYSSPTLASAISNLTPAFTFVLAVIFRMEAVVWKRSSSKAKIIGTVVSITGAFVVTLYKGSSIIVASPSTTLHHQEFHATSETNWKLGGFLLMAEYILIPLWYIIQTQIMREYPAEMTVVCLYNLCVSIIAAAVTLVARTPSSAWVIQSNTAVISILCSGLLGSALNNTVHTWALRMKGPLFVASFKPLSIAIAVAMGVLLLGDNLYLGSLVGAVIISVGFYTVIWGKSREEINLQSEVDESDLSHKAPLLEHSRREVV